MASPEGMINPLHSSVIDRVDPDFARVYNKYQAPKLRADQVPYEIYNQDRPKYTVPTHEIEGPIADVEGITLHKVPVTHPKGEIAIQVIRPTANAIASGGLATSDGLLPAYIDFHGGGFVIGSLATDATFCRGVAHHVGCIVVNVDYRLAPEYPHPTQVLDCLDALRWVVFRAGELGIDADRLAVGGFSAGGCLAAALALLVRDEEGGGDGNHAKIKIPPLRLQLLVVPVLDCRFVPEEEDGRCDPATTPYASYTALHDAPCLPMHRLVWFYNLWLGKGALRASNAADFRASPMTASSHAGLAPASIHCAALDPLLDEGRLYHQRLVEAGTRSDLTVYDGVGHPFGHWTAEVPAARAFVQDAWVALRKAFR
ncbi:hypothetical protein M406DRAFT_265765 [Cryphonectria parasitica EP155]|uniref:Alpha/beta hydrolase fold-3 domain-containing protein n=1 Tax=Cryphonectria parasitica (strain ATCC 38755 / EP155) TaxID=660469 RepID=A0A9P4XUP9_CRYP1|nr:uncharacterized protein M406DRAFT_265765 [Cryphonectria parasitica EP155]KAF3761617.1 hypothetical protein M406DRAFT_265765 [Cryphonectria parasitica EP155]